jgi:glycosidase
MLNHTFSYILIICFFKASALFGQPDAQSDWWKETVFYQIYMPSFQDSDGDGYSDFKGMTDRLDYIQSLGIKGIWLTPFQKSPKVDNGYDVANYYEIDPMYGTMNDFRGFLATAHSKGIKVIMDMVVNHTSTDCIWFQESRKSRDNPYRDYYIWRDEPNNWESFFGGKAWTQDSITNQFYYHQFDVRMADLNWTNPRVVEEIQNVLRFWLDLGIDGFRMDVINFLTTDGILADNPVVDGKQQHVYDIDQPGIKNAMYTINATVKEYDNRFLVGEIGSDNLDVLVQYQGPDLMDVVFNFNFGSIPAFSSERIFSELQVMENRMPGYPTLFFGSHDMPRLMDRLAEGDLYRAKALAALMLTAKGIPFIYYGDEVGMQNIHAKSFDDIIDIQGITNYHLAISAGKTPEEALDEGGKHNRDRSRSPMQWENSENAGFTTGIPWIKVHENFNAVNVQHSEKNANSILNTYKALINLRNKEKILQYGRYENLEYENGLIQFTRNYQGGRVTVIINFGDETNIKIPAKAVKLLGNPFLKANEFLIYKH